MLPVGFEPTISARERPKINILDRTNTGTGITFKYLLKFEVAAFWNVRPCNLIEMYKGKGKAVPLRAWSGPEGSSKLRFPDFMTTAQDGGKFVTPAAFTPREYTWYSFLLEAESTPRP
jgi:hypothetical protein